jgi:HEAT repeat protein
MTMVALLILFFQAGPAEDKGDCKAALELFHTGYRSPSEASRLNAVDLLSKHKCPLSIAALAPVLTTDTEKVRIAAAKALGAMDLPMAIEALSSALAANESSRAVFEAVAKGLQSLDWESGAEPLNNLLSKYHEKGMIDEVQIVIQVLGSLGSQSSVDPLLRLLEHAENEGKAGRAGKVRSAGNPKLVALEAPIKAALQAITGGNEPNYQKWKEFWHANRERLLASAVIVFRCKATGKHWEQKAGESEACPNHDKPEKDGQVVKTRLHSR